MIRTPAWLTAAFHAGADPVRDPRGAKRTIMANQISLSVAVLSLLFIIEYLVSGDARMGWLEIPISLGYFSVPWLNRAGRTRFARLFLITLANLDIFGYSLSLGTATANHLLLLLAGWAPLVLFDWEERKSIVYGTTLSSVLLLSSEAFLPRTGWASASMPGNDMLHFRFSEMATLQIVQVLLIVYFFRGNRRTEMAMALATETAQSADEAKGRFLARMGASIRAPLGHLLEASRRLLDSGLAPEKRQTAEDIRASARDLEAIVDQMLSPSRIEAGNLEIEPTPFPPAELGRQVLRPFQIDAERKGISLSLEAGPEMPALLLGDVARLKQILRNLVGNACKFTDKGRVVLRLGYGPAGPASAPSLLGEVEDTGVGIPETARARLFEPFAQAEPSSPRNPGGTGLGLSITRQLVERMGGGIGFRPGPSGGAVFRFHIPLPEAGDRSREEDRGGPEPGNGRR